MHCHVRRCATEGVALGLAILSLASAMILAGCGAIQPLGQVDGIVRLEGQPLSNVLVVFVPEGSGSSPIAGSAGIADSTGKFELWTEDGRSGAPLGSYRVVIEDLAVREAPRDADGTILVMSPRRVPERFSSPLTTTATAEVREGRQRVEVNLSTTP